MIMHTMLSLIVFSFVAVSPPSPVACKPFLWKYFHRLASASWAAMNELDAGKLRNTVLSAGTSISLIDGLQTYTSMRVSMEGCNSETCRQRHLGSGDVDDTNQRNFHSNYSFRDAFSAYVTSCRDQLIKYERLGN